MSFLDAMNFRHACKVFNNEKKISAENEALILEFGRLSPSSFGIEPWCFLVIKNPETLKKLRLACWNQAQITDASFVVVYLTYQPHQFRGDTSFLRQRLSRRTGTDEARYQFVLKMVSTFLTEQNTGEWAKRQTYLALSNMMTGAASLGIDSCPIEGFEAENLKQVLKEEVDWQKFDVSAICTFGYRAGGQTPRIREPLSSVMIRKD
jgi:nitroreductase